jgi:molecular chaperone GrpE
MSEPNQTPPPNGNGSAPAEDVEALKTELQKAKNDYLYLLAEFDNFRKNAIKERSELTKFGSERLVREFLNVFDNFERALTVETKDLKSFRDGIEMIAGELKALLKKFGVEEIKAEGEPFDPTKHEALSSEPRDDMPAGHVARVFKKAYKMHDKLIRPAQVTVSTAAAEPNHKH